MKKTLAIAALLILTLNQTLFSQIILESPQIESKLYLPNGKQQALIVGLGGSEGGNAWSSDHWKTTREAFLDRGYAFLALAYFGAPGTPQQLDKIAIDKVYNAIAKALTHPEIQTKKVAIVGGSRGADLALLLGSYYADFSAIVALAPSHAVFPGHTQTFETSCWTFNGQELPYIPVNEAAVPYLMKGDLRSTFSSMMTDSGAEEKATIPVEKINGPILLISATKDEIIPAVEMGKKITERLKKHNFKHYYEQIIVEGNHASSTQHFDQVFSFLEKYLLAKK